MAVRTRATFDLSPATHARGAFYFQISLKLGIGPSIAVAVALPHVKVRSVSCAMVSFVVYEPLTICACESGMVVKPPVPVMVHPPAGGSLLRTRTLPMLGCFFVDAPGWW